MITSLPDLSSRKSALCRLDQSPACRCPGGMHPSFPSHWTILEPCLICIFVCLMLVVPEQEHSLFPQWIPCLLRTTKTLKKKKKPPPLLLHAVNQWFWTLRCINVTCRTCQKRLLGPVPRDLSSFVWDRTQEFAFLTSLQSNADAASPRIRFWVTLYKASYQITQTVSAGSYLTRTSDPGLNEWILKRNVPYHAYMLWAKRKKLSLSGT